VSLQKLLKIIQDNPKLPFEVFPEEATVNLYSCKIGAIYIILMICYIWDGMLVGSHKLRKYSSRWQLLVGFNHNGEMPPPVPKHIKLTSIGVSETWQPLIRCMSQWMIATIYDLLYITLYGTVCLLDFTNSGSIAADGNCWSDVNHNGETPSPVPRHIKLTGIGGVSETQQAAAADQMYVTIDCHLWGYGIYHLAVFLSRQKHGIHSVVWHFCVVQEGGHWRQGMLHRFSQVIRARQATK
jgi:hypothetical protein